ncbi:MAG: biopolymer transporter ExbD [Patescibacteria group bacterium]|nr:biopolymer transporter ExbD [Patescibacteria group bacterium]
MAIDAIPNEQLDDVDVVDALLRHRRRDSVDMDITPMIDIVFLLLIFFLVAAIPDMQVEADLPPARHGVGVNPHSAIVFTLAERPGPAGAKVYLSDGKSGHPIPAEPAAQEGPLREPCGARPAWRCQTTSRSRRRSSGRPCRPVSGWAALARCC